MEEDALYQQGFNDGYLLQQQEPEIANMLSNTVSQSSYIEALRAGREQYLLEMRQRIKTRTKDTPKPSKEQSKGMSRER